MTEMFGFQSQGFELSYLAKVSEVKDTVHRQTLLHHVCHTVVEEFPDTTDLYSEVAALTRSAKVRSPSPFCLPSCGGAAQSKSPAGLPFSCDHIPESLRGPPTLSSG